MRIKEALSLRILRGLSSCVFRSFISRLPSGRGIIITRFSTFLRRRGMEDEGHRQKQETVAFKKKKKYVPNKSPG